MGKPVTISQAAEIAAFAETYAHERFGLSVNVSITSKLSSHRSKGVRAIIAAALSQTRHVQSVSWLRTGLS